MGWMIALGYLAGLVACARWLAPRILDSGDILFGCDDPSTSDLVANRALALFVATLWPLVLLGALAMWKTPKSNGQLKQELKEREERIRQLEAELGLGKEGGP